MALTNNAKFMHCLPVRRNVVVNDDVIDSENSIIIAQAANRVTSAQLVIKRILEGK
jgi:N-succinyl-L-ornithine transcarbamylase